jgi:dTDP-D-glucose 4,6-dehydratase
MSNIVSTGAGGLGSEVIKQLEARKLNINFVIFDLAEYVGTRRTLLFSSIHAITFS